MNTDPYDTEAVRKERADRREDARAALRELLGADLAKEAVDELDALGLIDTGGPFITCVGDYEWSTRDSSGIGSLAENEKVARRRIKVWAHENYTLHRRPREVRLGDWEDVKED